MAVDPEGVEPLDREAGAVAIASAVAANVSWLDGLQP
jgi:hypothetical protein